MTENTLEEVRTKIKQIELLFEHKKAELHQLKSLEANLCQYYGVESENSKHLKTPRTPRTYNLPPRGLRAFQILSVLSNRQESAGRLIYLLIKSRKDEFGWTPTSLYQNLGKSVKEELIIKKNDCYNITEKGKARLLELSSMFGELKVGILPS